MLTHLSIKSFALVDDVELDFTSGMVVLVGETGAGKSIIIDALTTALGERTSAAVVRSGAKKSIVEAVFSVPTNSVVSAFLAMHELQWESDDLVIRREVTTSGTSRCFINDTPVNAAVAQELSEMVIDFHGQHDTHGLLQAKHHREILDSVSEAAELIALMRSQWHDVLDSRKILKNLNEQLERVDEERSRLTFIVDDIGGIAPVPEELDRINEELRRAESSEMVIATASMIQDSLYSGESSAYDLIKQACDKVKALIEFDASLSGLVADLESAATACKETAAAVAHLADPEDFSLQRLEELRLRQSQLNRLVRKYGSVEHAINVLASSRQNLTMLENLDNSIDDAHRRVSETETLAMDTAKKLSHKRVAAAKKMSASVTESLTEMGMPSARFEIRFGIAQPGATGIDDIEFFFTANAGESPLPLARIASGGELSRVMLAIKKAQALKGSVGTMVFDEIDIGVSGRIARAVGDVMKDLCSRHQIICISHLPQIASLADSLIRVRKIEHDATTSVHAEAITGEDAVVEIARMISGESVTTEALDGARSLMGTSRKNKRS